MILWISHQNRKQQKKKSTNGTTSNLKASAKQKKQATKSKGWEKNFANHVLDKGLNIQNLCNTYTTHNKIYKNLIQPNNKKAIQSKNGQTTK